jgi:regulator of replication initiation timing
MSGINENVVEETETLFRTASVNDILLTLASSVHNTITLEAENKKLKQDLDADKFWNDKLKKLVQEYSQKK